MNYIAVQSKYNLMKRQQNPIILINSLTCGVLYVVAAQVLSSVFTKMFSVKHRTIIGNYITIVKEYLITYNLDILRGFCRVVARNKVS